MHILQELTRNVGKVSQVYVKVDSPANVDPVIDELNPQAEGLPIYSVDQLLR